MKRILVTGAGGSPATNFIRSLRNAPEKFYVVGTDADKYYLMRAEVDRCYLVPLARDSKFLDIMNSIIREERIEFVHVQNDAEMKFFSENRERLLARTFLPSKRTVRICQDKYLSYRLWEKAGLKVPPTMLVKTESDLRKAFKKYKGRVWLRATSGAGGKDSLPTDDREVAKAWIDFKKGWGHFTASELLEPSTVTWMSIWKGGELIVAQGRKRLYWELAKLSPSGVTGVTGTGVTVSDPFLDKTALLAIKAIDPKPHGLFGVDLTYDREGIPNPTEINIGRFFTTHHFFTVAGLNMPYIFVKLAYGEDFPRPWKRTNSLPEGLAWIRGVDFEPVFTDVRTIDKHVLELERRIARLIQRRRRKTARAKR